jgi:hypothetical protein
MDPADKDVTKERRGFDRIQAYGRLNPHDGDTPDAGLPADWKTPIGGFDRDRRPHPFKQRKRKPQRDRMSTGRRG